MSPTKREANEAAVATTRLLPKKRNPLLMPDKTPEHAELVAKRRLGRTDLVVKPGQIGTSNATKPENLGLFDYAHLRAPLPETLKGSEIFDLPQMKTPHPGAYFLMRRCSDGYVSATGMFKASFPYAKRSEDQAEREYLKSLPSTGLDEIAGNVWIPEAYALELAEDYGIVPWIRALLDDAPILPAGDPHQSITSPPKFEFKAGDHLSMQQLSSTTPSRGRGRPRAASPTKSSSTPAAAVGKPLASPRKRVSKAVKEANAIASRQASESLQAALDSAVGSLPGSNTVTNGTPQASKVTVEVGSAVAVNGDVETTRTDVRIAMPAGAPELPAPSSANAKAIVAQAKEMVIEARKLEAESSKAGAASKRKRDELDDEEDEVKDRALQPAKRARLLEQDLRKQKVRNRALFGVATTLIIGAAIPYLLGA